MMAFWSTIDDASELSNPGLHFTVGGRNWSNTKDYTICTSICLNGVRHVLEPSSVIEIETTKVSYIPKQYKGFTLTYQLLSSSSNEYSVTAPDLDNVCIHKNVYDQISTFTNRFSYGVAGYTVGMLPSNSSFKPTGFYPKTKRIKEAIPYEGGFSWHDSFYGERYGSKYEVKIELDDVRQMMDEYLSDGGNHEELKSLLAEYYAGEYTVTEDFNEI